MTGHHSQAVFVFPSEEEGRVVRPKNDEALMEAYSAGDYSAFEQLYSRCSGRVYGYLRKRISDPVEVDETFQRVFLKLHQTRQKYDPAKPFTPWLFVVCRSVLIDSARTRQVYRNQRMVALDAESTTAPPSDAPEDPVDLSVLSPEDRNLLQWRYLEEAGYEEMGRRLGTGTVTARKRVSRAVGRLRLHLKGLGRGK